MKHVDAVIQTLVHIDSFQAKRLSIPPDPDYSNEKLKRRLVGQKILRRLKIVIRRPVHDTCSSVNLILS